MATSHRTGTSTGSYECTTSGKPTCHNGGAAIGYTSPSSVLVVGRCRMWDAHAAVAAAGC